MKAKTIIPVLFFLFVSTITTAQNGPQARPEPVTSPSFSMGIDVNKQATHFDLSINNPEKKRLYLQISNRNLGMVVDTVVTDPSFIQRYNMEQVEDGQYTVVVRSGKEKLVRNIELKTIVTRNMEVIK